MLGECLTIHDGHISHIPTKCRLSNMGTSYRKKGPYDIGRKHELAFPTRRKNCGTRRQIKWPINQQVFNSEFIFIWCYFLMWEGCWLHFMYQTVQKWCNFISWQFEQRANEVVTALPWVKEVNVTMSAQPARPVFAGLLPAGLQTISNIVAVSSCKVGFCARADLLLSDSEQNFKQVSKWLRNLSEALFLTITI